jgi:putative hydrolase of HD superfamily
MDIKKFYDIAKNLKDTRRAGWVERGVSDPESVSDHSFMVSLLCLIFPNDNINKAKAVKMAVVHDLAESTVGDLISKENWEGGSISKADKFKLEKKAIADIVSCLGEKEASDVLSLWLEYEEGKSPESVFVKDIDILERIMQANEYQKKGNHLKPLLPFFKDADKIKNESVRKFLDSMLGGEKR